MSESRPKSEAYTKLDEEKEPCSCEETPEKPPPTVVKLGLLEMKSSLGAKGGSI